MTPSREPLDPLPSGDETAACLERLIRFRELVATAALAGVVLGRPEHLRYLVGWSGGPGPAALILVGAEAFLVAPRGSHDVARCETLGIQVESYASYDAQVLANPVVAAREAVVGILDRTNLRGRVGVELDTLPIAIARHIIPFEPVDVAAPLGRWRRVKDGFEQASIRRTVAALEQGFLLARSAIRPGVREVDVFGAVSTAITVAVGSPVRLDSNVGSGWRSALDDPHQTDRRLGPGDEVLVDLYPAIDGYVADLTRNFIVGAATAEQLDRHAVLEAALAAGEKSLRTGALARDVDLAVRNELRRLAPDLATSMAHHAGHGLGLAAWEEPWLGQSSEVIIEAGMTVAIEPGLYRPGIGGMRVEGNFLVTTDGVERLDGFASMLIECLA